MTVVESISFLEYDFPKEEKIVDLGRVPLEHPRNALFQLFSSMIEDSDAPTPMSAIKMALKLVLTFFLSSRNDTPTSVDSLSNEMRRDESSAGAKSGKRKRKQ
jgi:hypothetical protein